MGIHSDRRNDLDHSNHVNDATDHAAPSLEKSANVPASTKPARAQASDPHPNTHHSNADGFASGVFWLMATAMLVLGAWFVGPLAVERYQYAATKGRVTAEYENAQSILEQLPLNDVSQAFQLVAQRIRPSVVSIRAEGELTSRGLTSGGQGSGVIMTKDGYVLTNRHVISGAKRVIVGLHDRRQFEGTVVGEDVMSDLAVIKIDVGDLLPADWGDSDQLNVGAMVWAVGSPYGLEQTVTSGIVSAKERANGSEDSSASNMEYLQTDAAVNPGNSGGPLVNSHGKVVGINTSIYGEKFQGISFAIPSSIAQFVFNEIVNTGKVTRSYLGIIPREVSHRDLSRFNLPDLNGALISRVTAPSPAFFADLKRGDVIRKWDGQEVRTFNMLYRFIGTTKPGTVVDVEIIRNGIPIVLRVQVAASPLNEG